MRRWWRWVWAGIWAALRPWDPYRSIKAALQALVLVSVLITTGLVILAIHSATELRVITIFSAIASLLITQIVANGLTAPLREMTAVARAMAGGDYSRRVTRVRRDEVGELAETFNRMAADLAAADRHRKELVANVSHELRTPIAALRAVLENVVDGVSAADPETMRLALQQTERLGKLVSQLLDLSRLDSGATRLDAKRFEVWPYLSAVLKTASLGMGTGGSGSRSRARADVPLHLDVSPALTAYADGERLHQVVANLVDNAVKHSPPGGRVTVRARSGGARQPGAGRGRRGSRHPRGGPRTGLRALPPRLAPGRRRRYGAGSGDRPLGGGSARRTDRSGRIPSGLPHPRHPSGCRRRRTLTQRARTSGRA